MAIHSPNYFSSSPSDRGDTDGRAVTKSVAFTLVSYQGVTIVGDSHKPSLVYTTDD